MPREQFQNLTEPMYYILLALTEERHGYEVMQIISEKTKGRVKVGPGTLYALLSRFQKEDIIRQISDDGRRKTYILTKTGRELLEGEYDRLKKLVDDGADLLMKVIIEEEPVYIPDQRIKKKRRNNDILF